MSTAPRNAIEHIPARVSLGAELRDVSVGGLLASYREHQGGGALPLHEHGAAYLCVVLGGGYEQAAGDDIDCRRGWHPTGHAHANRFGADVTRCVNLYFDEGWVEDPALGGLFADYRRLQLDPHTASLARLEQELANRDASAPLTIAGVVLDLAAAMLRRDDPQAAPAWLTRVVERISDEPGRVPDLAELSRLAGVHPSHLCRSFRRATGETIGAYSRRIRVEAAAAMLSNDLSIADIAAATGFYDQAHFARIFRRRYRSSPHAYRRQMTS